MFPSFSLDIGPEGREELSTSLDVAVPSSSVGVTQSDLTRFAFNIRYSASDFLSFERCYLLPLKFTKADRPRVAVSF